MTGRLALGRVRPAGCGEVDDLPGWFGVGLAAAFGLATVRPGPPGSVTAAGMAAMSLGMAGGGPGRARCAARWALACYLPLAPVAALTRGASRPTIAGAAHLGGSSTSFPFGCPSASRVCASAASASG